MTDDGGRGAIEDSWRAGEGRRRKEPGVDSGSLSRVCRVSSGGVGVGDDADADGDDMVVDDDMTWLGDHPAKE